MFLLTAYSDMLDRFDGGPGQISIHGRAGTSLRDPLGPPARTAASESTTPASTCSRESRSRELPCSSGREREASSDLEAGPPGSGDSCARDHVLDAGPADLLAKLAQGAVPAPDAIAPAKAVRAGSGAEGPTAEAAAIAFAGQDARTNPPLSRP